MLGKKDGSLNPSSLVKRNYGEWKPFFPDHTTAGESHERNPFLPATGVAQQQQKNWQRIQGGIFGGYVLRGFEQMIYNYLRKLLGNEI